MPDHLGALAFLYPEAIGFIDMFEQHFMVDRTSRTIIRKIGETYPEMSREEDTNPSEEYFMENFIERFQHDSRPLHDFLYKHNDGWSVQPEQTRSLLLETDRVDPVKVMINPPSLKTSPPFGASPEVMRNILMDTWLDQDKQFDMDDSAVRIMTINADHDDENAKEIILDLYEADGVFANWILDSGVDFEDLGDVITGDILSIEASGRNDLAEELARSVFFNKNPMHYTGLLATRSDGTRRVAVTSILSRFNDEYQSRENTPGTRREMESFIMDLIDHPDSGKAVQDRIVEGGLLRIKGDNKELYCDFMKNFAAKLEVRQHPFRWDAARMHREDCER